jgi:hypothetical protein
MLVVIGFLNREDHFVQNNSIPTFIMGEMFSLIAGEYKLQMFDNEVIRKCLGLESMK